MEVDNSLVTFIATTYYNITPIFGSIQLLCGYSDKNYSLTDSNGNEKYVLKIVNENESKKELTAIIDEVLDSVYEYCNKDKNLSFIVPKLVRTSADKLSAFTAIRYRLHKDAEDVELVQCNIKLAKYFDGMTMFEFINNYPTLYRAEKLYFKLGMVCGQLFRFFRTQGHLLDRLKVVRGDTFSWQLTNGNKLISANLDRLYPKNGHQKHQQRVLVGKVLKEYDSIKQEFNKLPEFILHSDLCNNNILINLNNQDKLCLIDFQDIQAGQQIVELAIMMLYNVLEQEQLQFEQALVIIPRWIYLGYQSSSCQCVEARELAFVPTLMKLRLCQSLINGQLAYKADSKNSYVMYTNQHGWKLLELMLDHEIFSDSAKLAELWRNDTSGNEK